MLVGDIRLKELEHGLIQGITTARNTLSYKIPCRAHQVMAGKTEAPGSSCRPQALKAPSEQNVHTWKKPLPVPTLVPKLIGSASTPGPSLGTVSAGSFTWLSSWELQPCKLAQLTTFTGR